MTIHDVNVVPVPKDRVVMVIDLTDEVPLWEFAHWAENACLTDEGLTSGWCVADHETLRWAAMAGDVAEAAQSVFDAPTHWMEIPAIPVATDVAA